MLAPTLSGLGERASEASEATGPNEHVRDVLTATERARLDQAPILVGHSYGAFVAAGVVGRIPLAGIVVLDGFLAKPGRSIFEMRPDVRGLLDALRLPASPWLVAPLPPEHLGFSDSAAAAEAHARLTPMPAATHETPLEASPDHEATLPRAYVRFAQFPAFANEAVEAGDAGWFVQSRNVGHFAILTDADEVAEALFAAIGHCVAGT